MVGVADGGDVVLVVWVVVIIIPAARARRYLQQGITYLTRRADIRAVLHESLLARRQQHRRPLDLGRLLPKERKNGQNKRFLFIIVI